jgi:hypothetical protein
VDCALHDAHTMIDGGGGGLGMLAGLESHEIRQRCCAERTFVDRVGVVHMGPPAQEVQQVHSITAQSGFCQAAHTFAVQKTIDPSHFPSGRQFANAKRTSCVTGVLLRTSHLEGRARASSNKYWNYCGEILQLKTRGKGEESYRFVKLHPFDGFDRLVPRIALVEEFGVEAIQNDGCYSSGTITRPSGDKAGSAGNSGIGVRRKELNSAGFTVVEKR